jgi:5-methylcytosine-specific restriction endonuclease McrA
MNPDTLRGRATLVLNKNWLPIQTTTTRDAIGMVAGGSAYIVDSDDYQVHDLLSWDAAATARKQFEGPRIRSMRLSLPPPEVIVLTHYGGVGDRRVVFSRANLFRRDAYRCQYCGTRPSMGDLTIDHVQPRSRGGGSTWENCVLACLKCNQRKANRTPKEARMALLRQPRKPTRSAMLKSLPKVRKESWEKFLNRAYWEAELEE